LISQKDYAQRSARYLARHSKGHIGDLNQARVKRKLAPLLGYKEITKYSAQIFLHRNTNQH